MIGRLSAYIARREAHLGRRVFDEVGNRDFFWRKGSARSGGGCSSKRILSLRVGYGTASRGGVSSGFEILSRGRRGRLPSVLGKSEEDSCRSCSSVRERGEGLRTAKLNVPEPVGNESRARGMRLPRAPRQNLA